MNKYDEFYDMCPKTGIKDEHLLACLRKVFDISMNNIDTILSATKGKADINLEEAVYNARVGIAYALSTAISVGMNAEAEIIREANME